MRNLNRQEQASEHRDVLWQHHREQRPSLDKLTELASGSVHLPAALAAPHDLVLLLDPYNLCSSDNLRLE